MLDSRQCDFNDSRVRHPVAVWEQLIAAQSRVIGCRSTVFRSRACAQGWEKLPLFGEPRTRRRFSKQYYAARQKSLLDAGIIRRGRWASVVLALPEADGAFVYCEHCREVSLRHAGKSPRRAQLPTSDEIDTPIGHGRLVIFHVRR